MCPCCWELLALPSIPALAPGPHGLCATDGVSLPDVRSWDCFSDLHHGQPLHGVGSDCSVLDSLLGMGGGCFSRFFLCSPGCSSPSGILSTICCLQMVPQSLSQLGLHNKYHRRGGGRGLTDIWFLSDLRAGSVRSSVSRAGPSEASLRGLCMLSSPCVLTRLPSMCACSLVSFYKDTSPTRPIPITSFLS